jgi:hypothetical protein
VIGHPAQIASIDSMTRGSPKPAQTAIVPRASRLGVQSFRSEASPLLLRQARLAWWNDLFDGGGDPIDFDRLVRSRGLTLEQRAGAGFDEADAAGRRAVAGRKPVPAAPFFPLMVWPSSLAAECEGLAEMEPQEGKRPFPLLRNKGLLTACRRQHRWGHSVAAFWDRTRYV